MYKTNYQCKTLKFLKTLFCLLLASAFTLGHLLRCENLEIVNYVGGFRRLASDLN